MSTGRSKRGGGLGVRSRLARRGAIVVAGASRALHLGSGSTSGGRFGLALDPGLLRALGRARTVALVSGTNGKTTTTRMLARAVATHHEVATSSAGANMSAGLVGALAGASVDAVGILEVDEGHLPGAIEALTPAVVVLLNLSRDQLDRVSEVRAVARRWRGALDGTTATVVANADDPLVVDAASAATRVVWVGAGSPWHDDAHHCPRCDDRITYRPGPTAQLRGWSSTCGFARPPLDAWVDDGVLGFADGARWPIAPTLPGRFNAANAAMATVAAAALGIGVPSALDAACGVTDVEGRFATLTLAGRSTRLLLAKNPAGFAELLTLVAGGDDPLVIGINARVADGHDPSWLWDVPFESLSGRIVVATGERAADLAVRLLHAGALPRRVDDPVAALLSLPEGGVEFIGNYTAFQDLRRAAARRRDERPRRRAPAGADSGETPLAPGSTDARHRVVAARPSALRLVVVHPDLLGTYGDGGNARVLANRARWRGIAVEVVDATSDAPLPTSGDLYLLGGGEDGPQRASAEALGHGALAQVVDAGAVVLAVCAGFQILGETFPAADGTVARGLGLLDVTTERGPTRAVGELLVRPAGDRDDLGVLTGFENHRGRTSRGPGTPALGAVTLGTGNGDGTDGAVVGRIFGTYLHGPVCARNPAFADALLALAVGSVLGPLDDPTADALHAERVRRARRARAPRVAPSA
jgi:CobQ-like glutamine amidotransferase family enzyme/UDP-N-acetylmuramyl tripeptide synthase